MTNYPTSKWSTPNRARDISLRWTAPNRMEHWAGTRSSTWPAAVEWTTEWYAAALSGEPFDAANLARDQIARYMELGARAQTIRI